MRVFFIFMNLLTTSHSFSQMRPIDKVYIVEGVVADKETLKAVPSAILYNDSLGITTTSDENGYFKIVVPDELLKNLKSIPIDIVKTDYKTNRSGLSYNPAKPATTHGDDPERMIWNYDVKIFWMAKIKSNLSSTESAHAPAIDGIHGAAAIKLVFDEAVTSDLREKKFDQLKQGNDKVFFPLDGEIGLATSRYDIIVIGKLTHVFINDKKVNIADINKLARRNEIRYDKEKSNILTKKYGKETLAFVTTSVSETSNKSLSIKATLEIEIEN
jgi:hypothetical protein